MSTTTVVRSRFPRAERLAGSSLGGRVFFEGDAKLLLADAVLGTQTLLFAQTNGVVRVGLALGATVLAGSVRTLFEVLGRLRGQGDAQ